MKAIVDIINASQLDKKIYEEYLAIYQAKNEFPLYATLFANISFLLSCKNLLDYLLLYLEKDIADIIATENLKITPRKPTKRISFIGLSWPLPEQTIIPNDTHHVVSRALLREEQNHGINCNDKSILPTFLGVIPESETTKILNEHLLWNEDTRLAPLFYHGKMTHRIQCYVIMKAFDLGFITPDEEMGINNMIDILDALFNQKNQSGKLPWDIILDTVSVARNFKHLKQMSGPNPEPLTSRFKPNISVKRKYQKKYVFGMDPFFLHSYLLSCNNELHPLLTECLTRMFCKSAAEVMQIEKNLGYQLNLDRVWPTTRTIKVIPIKKQNMKAVMQRMEYSFKTAGMTHTITPKDVYEFRQSKGKESGESPVFSRHPYNFWKSKDGKFELNESIAQAGKVQWRFGRSR